MKTEEQIKFLERIIPISRFYTKPYISEKTSKLIWMFFILSSIYILLFSKVITIREFSIYGLSIQIELNKLIALLSISAPAILIKALMDLYGDIKNNRYELELNAHKFRVLNKDISNAHAQLMHETESNFTFMSERRGKLTRAYEKALNEKRSYNASHSPSYQEVEMKAFFDLKCNFILSVIEKFNNKSDEVIKEKRNNTMIFSTNIESLSVVVKSYKKQWWITTLTNFTPSVLTLFYIFYMHFGNYITDLIELMKF
ncbi:hypothetical protein I6G46_08605 [Serratia plymuthica]|uniref:hypothetical protein n=1 Tax=Serratia plymuthica TaxID=82996 RepID=UPI0018D9CA65|nr:hypothetical protein [Serratia plymuthica]QPS89000.1 hypothetical protein I6G46_08605 [Serratia plymuthica]